MSQILRLGQDRSLSRRVRDLNMTAGPAEIGQWYLHQDKGEMFLVTGIDGRDDPSAAQRLA